MNSGLGGGLRFLQPYFNKMDMPNMWLHLAISKLLFSDLMSTRKRVAISREGTSYNTLPFSFLSVEKCFDL